MKNFGIKLPCCFFGIRLEDPLKVIILSISMSTHRLTFLVNGISSVLGWNAVLAAFDYFQQAYPAYPIANYFPIPVFLAYLLIGVLFHKLQQRYSYKQMIVAGLVIVNLSMVLMLVTSIFIGGTLGFAICMVMCFVNGAGGNLSQLSFYALINYLSEDVVAVFTVGSSLGGLMISCMRAVVLLIAGPSSNDVAAIVVYFTLALAGNMVDVWLNIRFFRSEGYYRRVWQHEKVKSSRQKEETTMLQKNQSMKNQQTDKQQTAQKPVIETSYLRSMINAHREIFPFHLLVLLNFTINFTLFPALILKRNYQQPGAWPITILLMCYSIGDTLGKSFCRYRNLINRQSVVYVFCCRLYFFWTMIMLRDNTLDDPVLNSDITAYFNVMLFAFSSGIITSKLIIIADGTFVLMYEQAKTQETKRYGGILGGISLQVGMILGTLLALPINLI